MLLVDDVLSSGDTIKHAIKVVTEANHIIAGILVVVNRFGKNEFEYDGMKFPIYSLFLEGDFK
jgi:adenine/guanine phosphoribosyltransferase-like PRPP-binding protein